MNKPLTGIILGSILILGLIFRMYDFKNRFIYAHDNDLASWIVKDIVVDRHPRLIGQQTSMEGIYIGGLFYYSLIPFYLLTNMDPIGSVAFSWIIGFISILSVFWVFRKVHSHRHGLIASIIYAASYANAKTEREVVPTTPVMLWTVWFYYAIFQLNLGNKNSLIILAVLFGLVWHLNLALALLFPLVLVTLWMRRSLFKPRDFIKPILVFVVAMVPLFTFEYKHNFLQTKALISTLTRIGSGGEFSIVDKLQTPILYAARNINRLFFVYDLPGIWFWILPGVLLVAAFKRQYRWIYLTWFMLFIGFFSLHPIQLSEYYLNGLNIIWISIFTFLLLKAEYISRIVVIVIFVAVNLFALFTDSYHKYGYVEKTQLVNFIKDDALSRGYPCVAISYITDPGYDLGYRYLLWQSGLWVKRPNINTPVYSIVFPHSVVNSIDKSFGAIGLELPDYKRYTNESLEQGCIGADDNVSGPMLGFTK